MNRCCTPPPGETSPPVRFASVRHRLFSDIEEEEVSVARQLGMDDDRSSVYSTSPSDHQNDVPSREDTCPYNPSQPLGQVNGCVAVDEDESGTPLRLSRRSLTHVFIDTSGAGADGRTAALGLLNVPMSRWQTAVVAAGHTTPACCQTPQPHRTQDLPVSDGQLRQHEGVYAPLVTNLLFTPQMSPTLIAMRHQLDVELDETNAAYRAVPLPAVTTLLDGQLYMGGYPDETTLPILRQLGVGHIVNCCAADYRSNAALAPEFCVYDIDAFDSPDYLILHHDYDQFNALVSSILARGERVFVHCIAGVNRSVTLCAAFLIERCSMTPIEVAQLFRARQRMRILENVSFRHQIIDHYLLCASCGQNEEEF